MLEMFLVNSHCLTLWWGRAGVLFV